MDSERLEAYVGSLTRCLGIPAFLDRFYEIFLASSPEVAEKFKDTNFARQKVALGQSLYLMVMAAEGGEAAVLPAGECHDGAKGVHAHFLAFLCGLHRRRPNRSLTRLVLCPDLSLRFPFPAAC